MVDHPGLIIIRNAFNTHGQRYWMARSLKDYPKSPNRVNLNEHLFNKSVLEDWWSSLQQCDDKDEARRMKISMRWTTLGYHHNWDTKVYSEELHSEFPLDLEKLTNFFANALGYENFKAQAAIVNYYPIGTTLAGHTDHSEKNLEAPLFSFRYFQYKFSQENYVKIFFICISYFKLWANSHISYRRYNERGKTLRYVSGKW